MINEAQKIDGFDPESQHAFDKLAAHFAVFKTRFKPENKRYITNLNAFLLKFMQFMDKAETTKAKAQIKTFVSEIHNIEAAVEKPKTTYVSPIKEIPGTTRYVNPNNGGEYYDGDIHVYEMPADDSEDVKTSIAQRRSKGYKVRR